MLTDAQLERYARHIVLPEIGGRGQTRLLASSVAVVGAGGLGSPCLQYLAAAGVGRLTVIDDDVVDASNLQRQVLHGAPDIGVAKTASAAAAIARLNPDVAVSEVRDRLTAGNADALLAGHDVLADGSDSFATRLAVGDAAVRLRIPLVSAALGRMDGQVAVFAGHLPHQPCYRCFAGSAVDCAAQSCAEVGVLGALAGVVGSMQALEVIRALVGFGEGLAGKLLLFDATTMRTRTLTLPKDPGCPTCGG